MRHQRPANSPLLALLWTMLATVSARYGGLNIFPTKTKPDLAIPACTTFTGDIQLRDGKEANFDGYETINGTLTVYQQDYQSETSVYSDTLRHLNGSLVLGAHPGTSTKAELGDVNVSFPSLEYIRGLVVDGYFGNVKLSFGPKTTLDYLHINRLRAADSTLYLNVTAVSGLYDTRTDDEIRETEADAFYSPVVLLNTTLWITHNQFTSIDFPNLETVHTLGAYENKELETITLAARSATALEFSANGLKTSADLPNLTNITGEDPLRRTIFANLAGLRLPVLREVGSTVHSIRFNDNLFAELHLPRLEKANTTVEITKNSVLSDITIPRLSLVGELVVEDNPRLFNFTANVLKKAESIELEGNFTNVEFFSLEEVTGDFSVIGAPSMDCSWFDDNFFQKVVKGRYQCEGNHTKPDVPRTPSTPTTVEDYSTGDGEGTTGGEKTGGGEGQANEGASSAGLSTGAKAGIGAGVGLGGLVAIVGGLFLFWKKKKEQETGDPGAAAGGEEEGRLPEADGKALPPASPSPVERRLGDKHLMAEADSKALGGAELDSHPREQAGTREELDNTYVRAELSSATAKGPGVVELPA